MTPFDIDNRCLQKQKLRCSATLGEAIRLRRVLKHRYAQLKYLQLQTKDKSRPIQGIEYLIQREKQLIANYLDEFHHQVRKLSVEKDRLRNLELRIEGKVSSRALG